MMVELVVCFLPAGKRLAVDGDGAVIIGMHAMSIVLKRIDMQSARPHMDLFTLALVDHMDAAPANMDFLALIGINDVDTAREGNIDKWLIAAIGVLGRILGLASHIRRLGAGATVLQIVGIVGRLPIQQLIQRHAIQRGERNKVIGIGRGFAALPFTDSLTTHTQLSGKRLLRKSGSLAAINEPLRHRKIHGSSFHVVTVIE